jgi:hypothetical protein
MFQTITLPHSPLLYNLHTASLLPLLTDMSVSFSVLVTAANIHNKQQRCTESGVKIILQTTSYYIWCVSHRIMNSDEYLHI